MDATGTFYNALFTTLPNARAWLGDDMYELRKQSQGILEATLNHQPHQPYVTVFLEDLISFFALFHASPVFFKAITTAFVSTLSSMQPAEWDLPAQERIHRVFEQAIQDHYKRTTHTHVVRVPSFEDTDEWASLPIPSLIHTAYLAEFTGLITLIHYSSETFTFDVQLGRFANPNPPHQPTTKQLLNLFSWPPRSFSVQFQPRSPHPDFPPTLPTTRLLYDALTNPLRSPDTFLSLDELKVHYPYFNNDLKHLLQDLPLTSELADFCASCDGSARFIDLLQAHSIQTVHQLAPIDFARCTHLILFCDHPTQHIDLRIERPHAKVSTTKQTILQNRRPSIHSSASWIRPSTFVSQPPPKPQPQKSTSRLRSPYASSSYKAPTNAAKSTSQHSSPYAHKPNPAKASTSHVRPSFPSSAKPSPPSTVSTSIAALSSRKPSIRRSAPPQPSPTPPKHNTSPSPTPSPSYTPNEPYTPSYTPSVPTPHTPRSTPPEPSTPTPPPPSSPPTPSSDPPTPAPSQKSSVRTPPKVKAKPRTKPKPPRKPKTSPSARKSSVHISPKAKGKPKPPEILAERAEQYLRTGQYSKARDLFAQASEQHPENPSWFARWKWAEYVCLQTELETVRNALLQRAISDGSSAEYHIALGQIAKRNNDLESALRYFQNAVHIEPTHTEAIREARLLRMRVGNQNEDDTQDKPSLLQRIFGRSAGEDAS